MRRGRKGAIEFQKEAKPIIAPGERLSRGGRGEENQNPQRKGMLSSPR